MLAPLLLASALFTQAQAPAKPEPKYEMKTFQFVMLKKGNPVAMTADESQKKMQAHLAHLEDLWLKKGKAVLLGPLTDNSDIRGIVVLDATSEEAKKLMGDDPFVSSGAMVADIRPLMAADKLMKKPPKFLDLMPYTLGFFKRPEGELPKLEPDEAKKLQAAHLANNDRMWKAGHLVWAGPFLDGTNLRGLLVFRTTDRKRIEELLKEDPLVKLGRLVFELHPAMTAKGALPEPPSS